MTRGERSGGEAGSPCERMTGGQRREEEVSSVWFSSTGTKKFADEHFKKA